MSVVINDFEIIPDSPDGASADENEAPSPSRPSVRPTDVLEIVDRDARRRRRLRAH